MLLITETVADLVALVTGLNVTVNVPLAPGKKWIGRSKRGTFGDVIEELDWSVGEILGTLRREGLDQKTLVVFSSDNGPWLIFNHHGG